MALSVQTNTAAMTALKNLNTNSQAMNNSLNRLSSGFRINSAADDASGFAVSSKLDAQTGRLKAAAQNATQATAMVKMADAGVNEIQNMVNRIQTLATQAASSNNSGELGKLDAERVKLQSQIDKIANSTNYNGVNLLNGKDAAAVGNVTAVAATGGTVSAGTAGFNTTAPTATGLYGNNTFNITTTAGTAASAGTSGATYAGGPTGISAVAVATAGAKNNQVNGLYTIVAATATTADVYLGTQATGVKVGAGLTTGTAATFTLSNGLQMTTTGNQTATGTSGTFTVSGATAESAGTVTSVKATSDVLDSQGNVATTAGTELLSATTNRNLAAGALTLSLKGGQTLTVTDLIAASQTAGLGSASITGGTDAVVANYAAAQSFQVGADNNTNNQVTVDLRNSYTTSSLGLNLGDILSQANAQTFINTAKTALNTLITQRADLGATQNQLGFVSANLATSIEQTTASVSSIKDADMALEMANFTKNKILTQAGTSMLAQANQASQNVMTLFR